MQPITVSIFYQKNRDEEEKLNLMLYSTYLFIPCPQSNSKKCYAKELKENEKKKGGIRNLWCFLSLSFFKIHIDSSSLLDNNFIRTERHSVSFTICIWFILQFNYFKLKNLKLVQLRAVSHRDSRCNRCHFISAEQARFFLNL